MTVASNYHFQSSCRKRCRVTSGPVCPVLVKTLESIQQPWRNAPAQRFHFPQQVASNRLFEVITLELAPTVGATTSSTCARQPMDRKTRGDNLRQCIPFQGAALADSIFRDTALSKGTMKPYSRYAALVRQPANSPTPRQSKPGAPTRRQRNEKSRATNPAFLFRRLRFLQTSFGHVMSPAFIEATARRTSSLTV
jgi:hypothetical protein